MKAAFETATKDIRLRSTHVVVPMTLRPDEGEFVATTFDPPFFTDYDNGGKNGKNLKKSPKPNLNKLKVKMSTKPIASSATTRAKLVRASAAWHTLPSTTLVQNTRNINAQRQRSPAKGEKLAKFLMRWLRMLPAPL